MPEQRAPQEIELNVENVAQLFHTLDPFPFPERDLDKDAEEFIVGWARELPRGQEIRIVVHLPATEAEQDPAKKLGESIRRYFAYRAQIVTLEIKELFRLGRFSLGVGACVLLLCVVALQLLGGRFRASPMGLFVEESLVIVGWVANWRPIELLLYDWWPVVRRRKLFRRLAVAEVELRPYPANMPRKRS